MSFLRELSARRSALAAPVILTAIALTILLAGCPEETSTPPPAPTPRAYTCEFGTPVDGTTTAADTTGCQTCESTHEFQDGATAGGPGINCVAITAYVCQNGIAIGDAAPSANLTGCQSCTGDFALDAAEGGAGVSCVTPYICTNGDRIFDAAPMANEQGCRMCDGGFALSAATPAPGVTCVSTSYTCQNGNPIPGVAATTGAVGCQTCNRDYILSAAMGGIGVSCVSDADNDNIADGADNCPNVHNPDQSTAMGVTAGVACDTDIDDDDDGLIEIWTLEQLHNMRYNLAGTSYDDEEADTGTDADTGVTTGAGATEHANCDDGNTATTIVLCGYELMQDLDFDLDGDGSTLNPDGTLDTDDNAAPYFVVADGGWDPVGTEITNNRFAAIFEGNGFTISNLAIRRNLPNIGFFGTARGAYIRNIGIIGGLVAYTGSSSSDNQIGAIIGNIVANTTVSGSYAAVNIDAGDGSQITAGGLVGFVQHNSTIVASYATGDVTIGSGAGFAGGLVGSHNGDSIIASYATGDVTGSNGNDTLGGLVGIANVGPIIASYATGDIIAGGGSDNVGGLVGASLASVTASYATGNVDNGAGTGDRGGALTGLSPFNRVFASYGFGEVTNEETAGNSTKPAGITAATALTAANTAACNNLTYTTETACTSTSLAITAGAWDSTEMECSAPATNPTAGVDYTTYTTMATCTAPGTKTTADTWSTWSNAANNTLNAWVFGTGVAPKLRYADYDGAGSSTTDYCALFPSTVTCSATGDELPGQ